jgi:uncharacterized protein (TIGR03437 family)
VSCGPVFERHHVRPAAALPGVDSKYAKPGDTLILYGIGFGPTTPNINAGQVVSGSNSLAMPLPVTFGGTPATLTYRGLTPNLLGLISSTSWYRRSPIATLYRW